MTAPPAVAPTSDRSDEQTVAEGPTLGGFAFGPGWDRQDRWLRFTDPVLEHAYREAMTVPTRRRFRAAGAFGIVAYASVAVLLPAFGLGSPGPPVVVALIMLATFITAIVWAGRVGLRGLWGLTCAVEMIAAIPTMAMSVAAGAVLWLAALQMAGNGVIAIAWVRVAWWVAAAMSTALVVLFGLVALPQGVDAGVVAFQAFLLAVTLGVATVGS